MLFRLKTLSKTMLKMGPFFGALFWSSLGCVTDRSRIRRSLPDRVFPLETLSPCFARVRKLTEKTLSGILKDWPLPVT